uniref:Uncharacterized protein n=1 Tax=Myoviridae sp. ctLnO19 TaxID=2825085 RepID=A0A8S5P1U6_9CAUD|nr:MAG TPA: hypothetical protein [Myoviridae sp. ctLnO19]
MSYISSISHFNSLGILRYTLVLYSLYTGFYKRVITITVILPLSVSGN